jgi:hypothetical protein
MFKVFRVVVIVVGLAFLPFMVALLFNASAEAFLGAKEPVFETAAGLLVGGFLSASFGLLLVITLNAGRCKWANGLLIAVLLIDLLAIPVARWLITLAYASPSSVIELW